LNALIGPSGANGAPGAQGPQGVPGTNGTNGLNALINTTTEPAGANCANGGTKIETGLDANENGVLDGGEVNASQTKYVCDGYGVGSSGGIVQFSNMEVYSTPGTYTWTCPAGVTKVMVELWGAGGGGYSFGGQGGGYGKAIVNVNPGSIYQVTCGLGGCTLLNTTPCPYSASPGGYSSFSNIIAFGGNAGISGGGGNLTNKGTSNAPFSINGAKGLSYGGNIQLGGGAFGISPAPYNTNGYNPAGGGAGAPNCGMSTCGGNGRVIIYY
jgi:hypothetical protein